MPDNKKEGAKNLPMLAVRLNTKRKRVYITTANQKP
jgi:hypothetical protein